MYLPNVANTLGALGYAHLHWQQPKQAEIYLKEAIELLMPLAQHAPQLFNWKLDFAKQLLQQALNTPDTK
ncbi:hypothetical protein W03_14330 [Nitrosomonas sp. PY1]|uniref:hypothetical protein n=1 Tax=Nitrosomonas sp. PY1 TaxID=1803906 RepID=UPI001FC83CA1|nr:hypothetical protein [Nitrosomonas sp. PY1]GKS69429.1 hypothetical protein W03_14330 [Nitrosomonas sp. PY1]